MEIVYGLGSATAAEVLESMPDRAELLGGARDAADPGGEGAPDTPARWAALCLLTGRAAYGRAAVGAPVSS